MGKFIPLFYRENTAEIEMLVLNELINAPTIDVRKCASEVEEIKKGKMQRILLGPQNPRHFATLRTK